MLIVGLIFVVYNLQPFRLQFFCVGTLWSAIGVIGSHDLIYGEAGEQGIHYRQYLALRFLRWEEIAIISWTNANIVHFHIKPRGRSHRILSAQSQEYKSWTELYSGEPEFIRWLTLAKPPAADGIELRDPAASMPTFLGRNPRIATRVLQFLLVVIVVVLILSIVYTRH
jgi:hypothetical protein